MPMTNDRTNLVQRTALAASFIVLLGASAWLFVRGPWHGGAAPQTVALYVESHAYASTGRVAMAEVATRLSSQFPSSRVAWQLVEAGFDDVATLAAAIDRWHPQVVVFANDGYADMVLQLPDSAGYVVPSDYPPAVIDARFAAQRAQRRVAFVSWYAANSGKLLELLERACAKRPATIAAFFHKTYVENGIAAEFAAAAQARHIALVSTAYEGLDDLRAKFAAVVADARPDAVHIAISEDVFGDLRGVAAMVSASGLPGIYSRSDQVEAGGMLSSDAPGDEALRQIALYAGLLINGVDSRRLVTARPTRFEITVNLAAAGRAGCALPYELLAEAHDVIDQ